MSPSRALLFFAPHAAVVLAIASAETIGWDAMLRLIIVSFAALPWWCRSIGRGWSIEVRFFLGSGLATFGLLALFLYVLLTSQGPNDWTLAALILGFTLAFVPYSIFASFWRRR